MKREVRANRRGGCSASRIVLAVAASLLLIVPVARASTGDVIAPQHPPLYSPLDGWQAGTCKEEPPQSAEFCSPATPAQFFERAAAHPQWGFTQFIVKHTTTEVGPIKLETPLAELKAVRVDLPVGLSVNPQATPQCELADFEADACDTATQVGESGVTASLLGVPTPPTAPLTKVPVYNVVPAFGEPALFGLKLVGNEVFLRSDIAWHGDYHEGFTIAVPQVADLEPLIQGLILKNRLVFNGRAGDGTFLTTPSTCLGESTPGPSGSAYSSWLLAGSYAEAASPGYTFPASAEPRFESPIPPGTSPKECATIPFAPAVRVNPGTALTNSPAGAEIGLALEHISGGATQANSNVEDVAVTMPAGLGINPSAANGLQTCSDAQFGKGTRAPVSCPPASRIGSVAIETPALPPGSLRGDVFVGQQLSRDPLSGEQYRIFITAESARFGISARLLGRVRADPRTGQLTTTLADNPQVPVSDFRLVLEKGARAVLSSPPVCGSHAMSTRVSPWSGNPPATPSARFELAAAPGGGPCAQTMAQRPFSPSFAIAPRSKGAGQYSPLDLGIRRGDGQQEVKGIDVTLPPGFSGRLRGIPYCPEAALAAAMTAAGAAEAASPSCPAASRVGSAAVSVGTGPAPLRVGGGMVFLAGPYHGAPLSLAVVTPATAGPFDLGTAVVRVALRVDPETVQVRALSDPIPDVFGGAQLSIRSIEIAADRPSFTINPTGCGPLAFTGALAGGGADPSNAAAFSMLPVTAPFQPAGCEALRFRPRLTTTLLGARKIIRRGQHPRLRTVLRAREGDANIGRAALWLPHSVFLDQAHIRTICTRPRLAAGSCPAGSVYGHAEATTPLLDEPLRGPVYLVSSANPLPDLLVDLRGQVNVRLRGVISSTKGRMRTVFPTLPDVPVSRFALTMRGGRKGLLVNSRQLCRRASFSFLNLRAQNGRRVKVKRLRLRVPACRGISGKQRRTADKQRRVAD